ncbi:MAG: CubicO group peptidase beta-lactamase class family [Microbacteriaceae bacterium]|nr:CubicO group peptidase beta-lactamase class family [Microbacteriaceae bacterium]
MLARHEVEVGLEFGGTEGCTLAVGFEGEVIWSEGFGAAKADTPILMLSVTKTVFESALWILFDRGLLSPSTRIVEIIPEFMGGTQPELTVEMVETHVSGFAWLPLDYPDAVDRSSRVAAFEAWRLPRPAGFYEYHPVNAGWVLAELVERVTGRDFREFLGSEVLVPLGLGTPVTVSLGESESALASVLFHRNYADGYTPDPALTKPMAYALDTLPGLALGTPGVAGVGTAAGIAALYQAYLHDPGELWNPEMLADARDRTRVVLPDPAGRPMRRTLSFVQAGSPSERYGERTFFGPHVSELAFGHQGQGGQVAWADPATGLSFAFLTNTVVFPPGGTFHGRSRELSALAAKALG